MSDVGEIKSFIRGTIETHRRGQEIGFRRDDGEIGKYTREEQAGVLASHLAKTADSYPR